MSVQKKIFIKFGGTFRFTVAFKMKFYNKAN